MEKLQAKLVLEDGSEFAGWAFGKAKSCAGEVVFNTGMSGLTQAITDPACKGQIFVSTWPIAGNVGVNVNKNGSSFFDEYDLPKFLESEKIQVNGLIISDLCEEPSHYAMKLTLSSWMEKCGIPGIYGIDTRAVAIRLRDRGTMRGKIIIDGKPEVSFKKIDSSNHEGVLLKEIKTYVPKEHNTGIKIALIDCGVKTNIIRCLLERGAQVTRIPCNHDFTKIDYDAILISSGPGDPKDYKNLIEAIRAVLNEKKPVFGIGLGCLILALGAGADTYKLPFGHRSQNQPCSQEGENRCYATSQNHGFAVRKESIPKGWKTWFTNANDGTVEGIICESKPFSAVQFYPEGCPGSRDLESLFDQFLEQIKGGC